MPLQEINGKTVYVVAFETMPTLPITGSNPVEKIYARALTNAIQDGIITHPGKYGLEVTGNNYTAYRIDEP